MTNIKFCAYSNTYRSIPENYWLASIKNNTLIFDSWDKAIYRKFYFSKVCVFIDWIIKRILLK